MSEFAIFDVSKWPTVNLKLSGSPESLEEFEDYLSGFDLLYNKKKKINMVIDATDIGNVHLYYIARQAFHMHANELNTKKYVNKIALVVTSKITTKLLNSLFSMRKPVCSTKLFKTIGDANTWIS